MPLGMEVGLGAGEFVLGRDPAPHSTQFSAHVYCGQMAGWIKVPFGTEVNHGPGDVVLDVSQLSLPIRGIAPSFWPISIVVKWLDI